MGRISDFFAARSRSSVEKFEAEKQQYVGEMWEAAQVSAEREYRERAERAEKERDELARRIEALEHEVNELKAQSTQRDNQSMATPVKPASQPANKPASKPSSQSAKTEEPTRPTSQVTNHTDARLQIREQHPKETEGFVLYHDERLGPSSFETNGFDAWYTVDESGKISYYCRKERANWPIEWRDRWWGPEERLEVIERSLYECGIPLWSSTDQGKQIVARAHRLQRGGNSPKAAALQTLCDAAMREVRLVLNAGGEFDALEDEVRYTYATHLGRRVGYEHNRSLDGGKKPNWHAAFPFLSETNYLHCCLLESLCNGGAKGMVIAKEALGNNIDSRDDCVDLIRKLGLGFRMFAEPDEKLWQQLNVDLPEDGEAVLYDLTQRHFVRVCQGEGQLSFESIQVDVPHQHEEPVVNEYKAEVYVSGASYQGALRYLQNLETTNEHIRLCGAYQYTEGDMHDATWDHDYYFLIGGRPSDFGVSIQENTDWPTYSLHTVNALSHNRTYDCFYLRIGNTYLEASAQKPRRGEEAQDRLGLGVTFTFVPKGMSKTIDLQAQEILRSL